MPIQLPQGTSETLAPLRLPRQDAGYRVAPLEFVGQGLENVAGELYQIQAGADIAEVSSQVAKGQSVFHDTLLTTSQKFSNPDEFNEAAQSQLDEAYQQIIESSSNSRVQTEVRNRLANDYGRSKTKGKEIYYGKKQEKTLGDYALAGTQIINSLSRAGSEENRNQLKIQFNDLTNSLVQTNDLTPKQAETAKAKFTEESEKARAEYMRQTNPQGLKLAISAGEFPNLDTYTWEQRANETIRESELAVKKIEKERVDAVNKNLLSEMETTKSLTGFKSKILSMQDALPEEVFRFWIDRANRRIDDQQRDIERADMKAERAADKREREADRAERRLDRAWNQSDGKTLGTVIQGILTEPQNWDQNRILAQMGPGPDGKPRLGIGAAQQAVGLLGRVTKDPLSPSLQPLTQATKDLDFYRDQQLFIPKESRGKTKDMNPEELLINNEKHQNVMRELIKRTESGGDPQQVLNELMQPYMEEAVKTWYERTFTEFFSGSAEARQAERINARQRLARQGLPINETNIQKVIDITRKSKAKP